MPLGDLAKPVARQMMEVRFGFHVVRGHRTVAWRLTGAVCMAIRVVVTNVMVNDRGKALRFYTDIPGSP